MSGVQVWVVMDEQGDPWCFAVEQPAREFARGLWGEQPGNMDARLCDLHTSNPLEEESA